MADSEGTPPPEETEVGDDIWAGLTPHDDIQAAYNAFQMVDGIDPQVLSKETARKIRAIQRMSIKIVFEQIKFLHDCIFFSETQNESDE